MTVATRQSRDDGYGRSSRFYKVGEKSYPSVTTILQAVHKPALNNWYAKMEREACVRASMQLYEDIPDGGPKMDQTAYLLTLERRIGQKYAGNVEKVKAAGIGTDVHALIEWNMRRELLQVVGPEPHVPPAGLTAFAAYEDWRKAANLSPVLLEQTLVSERYGYAGTMDFAGEVDTDGGSCRAHVVGDFKTGKGIYAESLLQNAAYVHAEVEMGIATPGTCGLVVRLPKVATDPAFETRFITSEEVKRHFKVFLAVFDLWRWMEENK
jgi:hypothetical protein